MPFPAFKPALVAYVVITCALFSSSSGATNSAPTSANPAAIVSTGNSALSLQARSWLLLDMSTQQTLVAHEPDTKVEPASLTKLMTAYLSFVALKEKKLALDQRPPVSQLAYKAIGSRMFVDPATPATVEELLNGMIVQSGNDAAIILAEAIGGSEAAFAEMMNREAKRMGMTNSRFANATGLPDPQLYTTARDMAILTSRLIRDFPEAYALYYPKKSYTYNNITQENRNRLLFIDNTVDGVKTGHTDSAGYCLVSSSIRDQNGVKRRLLSVVMGTNSMQARAIESQKLLAHGFQAFETVKILSKGQSTGRYQVWKGKVDSVSTGYTEDLLISVPRGQGQELKSEVVRQEPLLAPIQLGQVLGTVRVRLGDKVVAEHPLRASEAVPLAGWFGRTWDSLRLMMKR